MAQNYFLPHYQSEFDHDWRSLQSQFPESFNDSLPRSHPEDLLCINGPPTPVALTSSSDGIPSYLSLPANTYLANLGESPAGLPQYVSPDSSWYTCHSSPLNTQPSISPHNISVIAPSRCDVWDPVGVTGLPQHTMPRSPPRATKRLKIVRDSGAMSDLGGCLQQSLLSDSGYATRSVGTRSVAGGVQASQLLEDARLPNGFLSTSPSLLYNAVHPPMLPTSPSPLTPFSHDQTDNQTTRSRGSRQSTKSSFACEISECDWVGKTRSELKKHTDRHEKPYKCDISGCKRSQGFATPNDLDRHRKSVHGILPTHGTDKVFRCFVRNCSKALKVWPRADNFRQHLTRVHKGCNVDEMLRKSNAWYESTKHVGDYLRAADDVSVSTVPSESNAAPVNSADIFAPSFASEAHLSIQTPSFYSEHTAILSTTASIYAPEPVDDGDTGTPVQDYSEQDTIANDDPISLQDHLLPSPGSQFLADSDSDPSNTSASESLAETVMGLFKALEEMESMKSQQQQDTGQSSNDSVSQTSSFHELLLASGEKGRVYFSKLLQSGYEQLHPQDNDESESDDEDDNDNSSMTESLTSECNAENVAERGYKCSHCRATVRRKCELKKHMKRHTKPYGCTFTDCYKEFGSKSDWKRHENSKHFHLESWRCQAPEIDRTGSNAGSLDTRECARQFCRSELFSNHLRNDHKLSDARIKVSLRTDKIGRNGQGQFWCGFCCKLVQLQSEGLDAWQDRFNHIDKEHFNQGQCIENWLLPSGCHTKGRAKQLLTEEELSKSAKVSNPNITPATICQISKINNTGHQSSSSELASGDLFSNEHAQYVAGQKLQDTGHTPAITVTPSPEPLKKHRFISNQTSQNGIFEVESCPDSPSQHQNLHQPLSAQTNARLDYRKATADSLMSFTGSFIKPLDPLQGAGQCVTCVGTSFGLFL
ncbi:hypothetical protein LOZ66_001271 [Ophidiomyces ophidiicola]|nr:hypothetical protein LOZ66_001271 [Ophidiomyces ophidiicola]